MLVCDQNKAAAGEMTQEPVNCATTQVAKSRNELMLLVGNGAIVCPITFARVKP
jgi:hypothetical protein